MLLEPDSVDELELSVPDPLFVLSVPLLVLPVVGSLPAVEEPESLRDEDAEAEDESVPLPPCDVVEDPLLSLLNELSADGELSVLLPSWDVEEPSLPLSAVSAEDELSVPDPS